MPREVFPTTNDRRVIQAFLAGKRSSYSEGLYSDAKSLLYGPGTTGAVVAWYDSAGALTVKLLTGASYYHSALLINTIQEILGQPEKIITREDRGFEPQADENLHRVFAYFIDGQEVRLDEPIVLLGPLGVQAFRASKGKI